MTLSSVFLLLILCLATLWFFIQGMDRVDFVQLAVRLANLALIALGIFAVIFALITGIKSLLLIV